MEKMLNDLRGWLLRELATGRITMKEYFQWVREIMAYQIEGSLA